MIFVFSSIIFDTQTNQDKTTHTHNKYALSLTTVQKFTMPSSTDDENTAGLLTYPMIAINIVQVNTQIKEEKSKPR